MVDGRRGDLMSAEQRITERLLRDLGACKDGLNNFSLACASEPAADTDNGLEISPRTIALFSWADMGWLFDELSCALPPKLNREFRSRVVLHRGTYYPEGLPLMIQAEALKQLLAAYYASKATKAEAGGAACSS
jgi:hypothetical protein